VNRLLAAILCGCILGANGCSQSSTDTAADPPVPIANRESAAAEQGTGDPAIEEATISGFRFKVPAGWRQVELSPEQQGFIDARFEIPEYGADVRMTLSTTSGGVQANIERWIGQFEFPDGISPDSETVEVDGIPVTLVDLRGAFRGMGQAAQAEWRMLGAAFDGAPRDFYVKLTGPEAAIGELRKDFRSFVTSARRVSS